MNYTSLILNVITAFVATYGFCILFSVPKKQYLFCGITGAVSWLIYCLLVFRYGEVFATFCATLAIVLLARILSIVRKCPVNILLIPGIIPLAPGSAVYYTAYYFVTDDLPNAGQYGFLTVKLAAAIVLGIIVIFAIPMKHKKQERT